MSTSVVMIGVFQILAYSPATYAPLSLRKWSTSKTPTERSNRNGRQYQTLTIKLAVRLKNSLPFKFGMVSQEIELGTR